ncbi:hypothetical protein IEQ34_020351 [Dendrobium chrysotoxum]|uniref:Auxin-responsive protein n=1 Tax=Dendrobium chrysotoxum TaxID=161865 RepID=A0AAV7G255_DENCH|nr:hypothetical protein IEQ34_020351 [Dendrobium chrysotoxum]
MRRQIVVAALEFHPKSSISLARIDWLTTFTGRARDGREWITLQKLDDWIFPTVGAKRFSPFTDQTKVRKGNTTEDKWKNGSTASYLLNSQKCGSASTPVVGLPPIRSPRKNLNQHLEAHRRAPKPATSKKKFIVKINVVGIPIGRKIDILAYDCYEKLSSAVDKLFRDLLAAQMDSIASMKENVQKHAITGSLDGSG